MSRQPRPGAQDAQMNDVPSAADPPAPVRYDIEPADHGYDEPSDFDEFWRETLAAARTVAADLQCLPRWWAPGPSDLGITALQ